MFVDTTSKEDAVREIYDEDEIRWGYLPNVTQLFSHHPEAYRAWLELINFTTITDALDSSVERELVDDLESELLEVLVVGRPLQPT